MLVHAALSLVDPISAVIGLVVGFLVPRSAAGWLAAVVIAAAILGAIHAMMPPQPYPAVAVILPAMVHPSLAFGIRSLRRKPVPAKPTDTTS